MIISNTVKTSKQILHETLCRHLMVESVVNKPVYHCGEPLSKEKFQGVIWFSDKPLDCFGARHRYYIDVKNPLIIPPVFSYWSEPIWGYCCNEYGEPKCDPNDPELTKIMPAVIWQYIQESDEELEIGDVPYIVSYLRKIGKVNYDAVIIEDIGETVNANIDVTDYCVFSLDQVVQID